jgi:type I restriction-modification system DNA methylase subunit
MTDYNTSLDLIAKLVKQFHTNLAAYRAPAYKEAHARQDLIDPLFIALGWDVHNEERAAPQYRQVILEDSLEVEGEDARKAPDYAFRIGETRKFFAEAKKPGVAIKTAAHPAYQLRRYAWSAKLPLSLLTDFEEFAVYDCRSRPSEKDKAAVGRINFYTFEEYPDRWREIWDVFSRQAVLSGSFDQFAQSGKKPGTEVDAEFLREIERWRDVLAHNMALRNPRLGIDDLNDAVQRTIDRIIFLRMAEDRHIEPYEQLCRLASPSPTPGPSPAGAGEGSIYNELMDLCRRADARYNAGLFDLSPSGDRITPTLIVDDKVLKPLITGLYFPQCPYEFSVLPAEILGNVYEQFLGKVIRLTAAHRAQVEEKPEVRKAGGVYYTPTYIVDYIVKNTVGKMVETRPEGSRRPFGSLRVLDMACGSGSFLLGAYKFLLDYYLRWYTEHDPEKNTKAVWQSGDEWKLTIAEKKRILTTHIFGVDIDRQAVEVTKLSLLLKVLEGESTETLQMALPGFQERALPNLDNNIKCGNSLIGPDYFTGQLLPDAAELRRVNPFDWDHEFPEVMKASGFDCVIGNPPYGALLTKAEAEYLRQEYEATNKDLDTYSLFMEKAAELCRIAGKISMIVPTGWYSGVKYSNLRRFMACIADPESFVNLPYDVFKAWVDTTVFVATKRKDRIEWPRSESCTVQLRTFPKRHRITSASEFDVDLHSADIAAWFANGSDEYLTYADTAKTLLISTIQARSKPLKEFADVQRGVTPFVLTSKPTHKTSRLAFDGTVRRYTLDKGPTQYIRFDDTLAEPKPERYFKGTRLLLRELISRQFRLQAVKVNEDFVTNKSMQSILPLREVPDLSFLLGLLNSRLMSWYFLNRSQIAQRDDFPKIVLKETRALPICPINFSDPADVARHDRMVKLVEQMLELHKRQVAAKSQSDRDLYQRQIDATDREIDKLVYELYGLTDEEIKIVEGAA